MSIIRRGDFHKPLPPYAPHKGDARGGFTFIELFIILGIIGTLAIAVYVAVATEQQAWQARVEVGR